MTSPHYISMLASNYRAALESLLFLNPRQGVVQSDILRVIQSYGQPQIEVGPGGLRVRVRGLPEVQNLFAVASPSSVSDLWGAMIYVRADAETILLLHIAVAESAPEGVALLLIAKLREIARQIRGVRRITIHYGSDQPWNIQV